MSTKYYTNSRQSISGSAKALTISPETLHFGVISNGFVYSLKFTGSDWHHILLKYVSRKFR